MRISQCVAVVLGCWICAPTRGDGISAGDSSKAAPPTSQSPGDQPQLTVDELVDALDSPDYRERQQATEILKSKEKPFTEDLKRVYGAVGDHEMRLRLREVAEHIFMREAQRHMGAFLGIALDGMLHEGRSAIRVKSVLPGTAAERAGLKAEDLIVAVDQHNVEVVGSKEAFIDFIGTQLPGTELHLTLLRDTEIRTTLVILGTKPVVGLNRLNLKLQPDQVAAYEQARREFHKWCADLAPTR